MKELYVIMIKENGSYDLVETDYGKIVLTKKEAYKELATWPKSLDHLKPVIKKLSAVCPKYDVIWKGEE
jgi:hypothetical protein